MIPDLNCDLGENESPARCRALMRWITSANIACGGHAGSAETMQRCVALAKNLGVRIGAHPGLPGRADFGRGKIRLTTAAFELQLWQQVDALDKIVRAGGTRLHHVKLHGGLYHLSDEDEAIARSYIKTVKRGWPGMIIYARANGLVERLARKYSVRVWPEAFADRAYADDGRLLSRAQPNALITTSREVRARVRDLMNGGMTTVSDRRLALHCRTICVHSDTPNAPRLAHAVRETLGGVKPRA
jgi:UPF0271 protein